jgi:hypothetical protein
VAGWAVGEHINEGLVIEVWRRAVALRQPGPGLLHHSDRGSIYGSSGYRKEPAARWAMPSQIVTGDSPFDTHC